VSEKTPEQEIAGLKLQVKALQKALGNFIAWTAQSANSPISALMKPRRCSTR
jgi:hypothetical protein